MINLNHGNSYKKRIPQDTCIYENLPYKERPSPPRNECQLYANYKSPKALRHQGTHNLPHLWHSRVMKVL